MANEENLRPAPAWESGQSGNPAGSSKKQRFTSQLLKMLDEQPDRERRFMQVAWKHALKGDFRFWKELRELVDGKIPDPEPEKTGEDAIKDKLRTRRAARKKPE